VPTPCNTRASRAASFVKLFRKRSKSVVWSGSIAVNTSSGKFSRTYFDTAFTRFDKSCLAFTVEAFFGTRHTNICIYLHIYHIYIHMYIHIYVCVWHESSALDLWMESVFEETNIRRDAHITKNVKIRRDQTSSFWAALGCPSRRHSPYRSCARTWLCRFLTSSTCNLACHTSPACV